MHTKLLCKLCVWDHADHKNSVKVCVEKDILNYVTALKNELEIMRNQINNDIESKLLIVEKIEQVE
jgi:hypothetical protein